MANKNQVTLTFAGDTDKLESAFSKVEGGAGRLADSFDRSSKAADEHGNAVGRLGEKADNSERSLIGVHDVIDGTATIMQGPGKQGIVAYIQGWADLAGGLAPLLLQLAEMNVKLLLAKGAQIAGAAATGVATAAQWAWNVAMSANPIGIIIVAIAALVAAIIFIATKTTWFQDLWRVAWGGIKDAALAVADAVKGAFKAAFNFVADVWNNTIGRLSWSVPGWVPFIGGNTISVPKLPHFHTGGVVPYVPGGEMLAVLQSGETVTPRGGGGAVEVRLVAGPGADSAVGTFLNALIRGGYVNVVAGNAGF